MSKYNSCLNTLEVSRENTTYVGFFSKNMAKVELTHYRHFQCSIISKPKRSGILGNYHTTSLTLHSDLAESAGIAS